MVGHDCRPLSVLLASTVGRSGDRSRCRDVSTADACRIDPSPLNILLSIALVAVLGGGAPDGAAAGTPLAAASAAPRDQQRAYAAGLAAYRHGYPPLLSRASQNTFLVNRLAGVAATTTPENLLTVLPNVDTAYTVARLDLRNGPVVVHVPAMCGRYYTLQLMDAYTDVFGYIGTRVTGNLAGDYAISGPATRGRVPRMRTIHSPTPDALLLGRTLVRPTDSESKLRAILGGFAMAPLSTVARGGKPAPSVSSTELPQPSAGASEGDRVPRRLRSLAHRRPAERGRAPIAGAVCALLDRSGTACLEHEDVRSSKASPASRSRQRPQNAAGAGGAARAHIGPPARWLGDDRPPDGARRNRLGSTCDCREGRAVGEHHERSDLCDRER